MSFDKTKAMRNAERFLSQGKIRAAIGEYQRVVESDPKDYSTLNILGDLYAKGNEIEEAVNCFKQVADHYSKQGFAQKAIAVYNKISRLDPNLTEISEKLAQLYQSRGSFAEARNHYVAIAEQYQRKGKKAEALEVWKQIAKLDPNNTEVYLKVAEFCVQNAQKEEATKAYTEAGLRFAAASQYESALAAFTRALEIRQYDLAALNGYVKAQIKLGYADDAARRLEKILEQSPYNREILYLLVDCHLESGDLSRAEESVVRLVEQEPANYPKFIDLVALYVEADDLVAASRILSMSSEHLLVGGKHEEFLKWASEITARDPEQLDALRLLVRYYSWQRDERELRNALERLAQAARLHDSFDDEKYALSQLVLIAPYEVEFARRLQEIKIENGDFASAEPLPPVVPSNAAEQNGFAPQAGLAESADPAMSSSSNGTGFEFASVNGNGSFDRSAEPGDPSFAFDYQSPDSGTNGMSADAALLAELGMRPLPAQSETAAPPSTFDGPVAVEAEPELKPTVFVTELSPADEMRLGQEIESIEFYIGQGYRELADRSIGALEAEFGNRPEFAELRLKIEAPEEDYNTEPDSGFGASTVEEEASAESEVEVVNAVIVEQAPAAVPTPEVTTPEVAKSPIFGTVGNSSFLDEFRSELGLEESAPIEDDDFDTVFQTAIAYKEMGLLEDAIRGFQDAVNRTRADDGSRRFFNCCNMLGLCFMEKGMPNLGVMWYKRALETVGLSTEERHAMQYELGNAYAKAGDQSKAIECFEHIYAVNVDYRDVSKRLEALYAPTPA